MSFQLFGLPVSRGVAIGRAVLVASSRVDVAHYHVPVEQVDAEVQRLRRARDVVAAELELLQRELPEDAPHELSALLDVHLMLLHDDMLAAATRAWVVDRRYNAEWAVSAQLEVLARQFDEMEDEYLRERKADLEQVVERLLQALGAEGDAPGALARAALEGAAEAGDPLVLVASDIAPADMIGFRRSSVFSGFITDVGGPTSHTAIVARSLDIPAVVGAREASRLVRQDDWIILDGDAGLVLVDPPPIVLEEYRYRQRREQLDREQLGRLRNTPAVTLDGERIELLANIELESDAHAALAAGAVGVGLFRTEFLFMNRNGQLPDEEEQYLAYRRAVESMRGLPVTIRTVDVGADKPLDRAPAGGDPRREPTLNPALGLRAIRWSLSEPSMFRQQLRAILRASAHGPVRLLIPMLAHRSEIELCLDMIARVKRQLDESGMAYADVPIGAMIEVPAAALIVETFLNHFDFLAIGTNDLVQYTLAIDRADDAVSHLYDPWHPAVLELMERTIRAANRRAKPVCICGEVAGDPAFTGALLAMGLRSFSMHPSQILRVKQQILRLPSRPPGLAAGPVEPRPLSA